MFTASPAYRLGGTSLLSTIVTTILNGLCYGSSRASVSDVSSIEAVTVSLSVISVVVLLALIVVWAYDTKIDAKVRREGWRVSTYGAAIGYLSVAAGITAGTIAWSTVQQSTTGTTDSAAASSQRRTLLISRCVVWAISIFSQGMFCGYLLAAWTRRSINHDQWPDFPSHELHTKSPGPSEMIRKGTSKPPSLMTAAESQRQSLEHKSTCEPPPRHHQSSASSATSQGSSSRYSDRTLYQHDTKSNSPDPNPATPITYPESATTRIKVDTHGYSEEHEPDTDLGADSRTHQLQLRNSEFKRSLDSTRPSSILSSPRSSCMQLTVTATRRPRPKLNLPDESNIHPLFRSDSRSPPPTPTPGTVVVASPAAGQTISVTALNRMRSTRSIGTHTPRSRSPLFERTDSPSEDGEQSPELILGSSSSKDST